jgi:cellulose synthase (UDP-forming)
MRTYLLDDAPGRRFAALAARLGAGYLTCDDQADAKAGNVNAVLAQTSGEFVAIFDTDHLPTPDFLDAVLGGFDDPRAASVQSGVAFHNRDDSLVSRATIEQAYDIYGPTSMGMAGCGAAPSSLLFVRISPSVMTVKRP